VTRARDDAVAPGEDHELMPTLDADLLEQCPEIILHHLVGDQDALAYFLVREPGANQWQNLSLTSSQQTEDELPSRSYRGDHAERIAKEESTETTLLRLGKKFPHLQLLTLAISRAQTFSLGTQSPGS
jgi:hypothetical protein